MPPSRRSRRAPEASGERLVDPPVRAAQGGVCIESLVDNNRLLRAAFDTRIGDLRFWELAAATRREVLTVAAEYTGSYRSIERPANVAEWIGRPLVVGGHQPDLFHAGVWLKNAALDAYAREVGGTALNLVVDTDRCATATVAVPVGSPLEARLERVPLDSEGQEMAWEERGIIDRDCFAAFGNRAADLVEPLVPDAILRRFWPLAVARAQEGHRLGLVLAQARHQLEERFGLTTLELPVSELMRLPTVMVFTGWLLSRVRALHEAYNTALAAHRRARRVRGRGRPMPDLAVRRDATGEWLEVPWWLWSRDDPRRRRVFALVEEPGVLALSDLETLRIELPIAPDTSPSKWVDALSRLEEHHLRLRPRALITTLIARVLIADVFVHGIGGAAYDHLTDDIVRRLTGCDPPRHAVVSGTLRLPIDTAFPGFASEDPVARLAEVQVLLRDLEFHPERHLDVLTRIPPEIDELVTEKRRWIDTFPTPALARRRCREIRATNQRLAYHLAEFRRHTLDRVGPLAAAIRARKILDSREYPWCFFPESTLRSFLLLESAAD
jgi:hypothetical protein